MTDAPIEESIEPLAIRANEEGDYGYILKTWTIDSHLIYPAINIPKSIYIPKQAALIKRITDKWGATILCIDDEPETIVGYIVWQPVDKFNTIVYWANVKGIFRRNGYLKLLLRTIEAEGKNLICPQNFRLLRKLKDKYNIILDPTLLEDYE